MALTIKTLVMRSLAAVVLAFSLVACESLPLDQPILGGSALSDTPLVAEVQKALKENAQTAGLRLKVSADEDVIILRGTVQTDAQAFTAEQVASSVAGVRVVSNHLYTAQ